ncbi:ABC transporter substrate-binding protein [Leucobacter sp. cx-328]|uniref:ABC transporter substrate-binding protein n=1 Tax=unclassified Leucobacter TaxID=2621730 RepID=UPI00165E241D|nr:MULTISPECIES: ABC transporter substrate-binding protein [unclassified Leucobacter]MBC9942948.1 ABC transporter substrate-binding protein [Leucobacter sp. cx-328]
MKRYPKIIVSAAAITCLAASMTACSSGDKGGDASGDKKGGDTLVVQTSFDLMTIDPARQFEFTGSTVDDAIYQTVLNFDNGDFTKPIDGLCSYDISEDNLVTTLTCEDTGAKFSNGDPVTVDDIVWSFQRLQGVQGNPSFYLDGVTIAKADEKTVTLTSETANPAIPYILPNSNLGILNSKVVQENGGTTDESDGAEQFLNTNSQGSGPYVIETYEPDSRVVLTYNEHYNGPEPKFKRVVMNNVSAETQLTDIQSGQANVVLDLSPDQVASLPEGSVQVSSVPSTKTIYIFANDNPEVSGITSNEDFREALSYAVDYDKVLELAGEGASRMASVVPNEFLGAVPVDKAPERDLDKVKAALEKAGYNGEAIPFHYNSDSTVLGVNIALLAESLQAHLKEAGINIDLKPAPAATQLDGYRSGKQPMGIGNWGADFPDPTNYLTFTPGDAVSMRAGWVAETAPEVMALKDAAAKATGDARGPAYEALFEAAAKTGPFIPLVQPVQTVVVDKSITSFVSNADNSFEFATAK